MKTPLIISNGCFIHFPSLPQFVPLVSDFGVTSVWMLLDISYFVIVTTIGLNLVLGIIVDSFSVLKDERVSGTCTQQVSLHDANNIILLCY